MIIPKKNVFRIVVGTALILSVALVAMQFSEEVDWKLGDFIIMGILLLGTGFVYELVAAKVKPQQRLLVGVVLLGALLLVWAELAVGVFGTPLAGT